jgi:hypothetical protein
MRDLRSSILALSSLVAAVCVASAQTGGGSSGGSSGGGSSAGGASSGSVSGGASGGGSATSGARNSPGRVQSPSLRIQSPSANTSTRQSVHPSQRNDPSAAPSKSEQKEKQVLGSGGTAPGSAAGDSGAGESQAGGSLLNLTAAQRDKVRRVIRTYSITPSDSANFQWRPGALVPPNVSLRPLPADLKDAIPDYQNFSYVMAGNRIAIVITEKREIDLVISG